jgi:L-alanine-DL-glutamate epimerase-like enolase superfamily enzyme
VLIKEVRADHYCVPLPVALSDSTHGTIRSFELVTVRVRDDEGAEGTGYTYTVGAGGAAVHALVARDLAPVLVGRDAERIEGLWQTMWWALHYGGRGGAQSLAMSAVDIALWDLRARLLGQPLVDALGGVRDEAAVYGSGGFTSYSLDRLAEQLSGWVEQGIPRVKMKLGRHPSKDPERLDAARVAIGDATELYVDANGAFDRSDAVEWANRYANDWNVTWFEEPVSSADADGLRHVREHSPPQLDVAAGEYAYVPADFRNLLSASAVDCLQIDVTRCGGYTGFMHAAGLAEQYGLQISAHCAPQASAHICCAVPHFRHIEYFHDHVRVEREVFEGVLEPDGGALRPDRSRHGHGLELRV